MIQVEITTTEVGTVQQVTTLVEVAGAGPQGAKGDTGDTGAVGPGVPVGGTEFQLIEKASGTDYDTRWVSLTSNKVAYDNVTSGLTATNLKDAIDEIAAILENVLRTE